MSTTTTSLAQQDDSLKTKKKDTITFSCHCKSIHLSIPSNPRPEFINECQCSICRRYGAAWSYFSISIVSITKKGSGNTSGFSEPGDGSKFYSCNDRDAQFVWCEMCGNLMYWWNILGSEDRKMGINTRCVDDVDDLKNVEWRVTYDMNDYVARGK